MQVRPVSRADFSAIEGMDLTYETDRYLDLERSGDAPEHTFTFRWNTRRGSPPAVYARPTAAGLAKTIEKADLFLVAEADSGVVGYLIALVPSWVESLPIGERTAEITDLAADRRARRLGAGRALIDAAAAWGREQSYRALWVEPRADNAAAIEFYLSLGFRLSGFNDRLYTNSDHESGRPTLYMYLELG